MESLSRPFHSRKLSNAAPFSNNDAVFSRTHAGPAIDVQDYREIFATSQPCSIPVLDLSTLRSPSDALTFDGRGSKLDYANIFGGFCDQDVAVSYQDLFGRDKSRAPSSTTSSSQESDKLSHQSPDVLKKQVNMSYNKISQKSKDWFDRTKHVTQSPAVTGFTRFIDEPVMEAEKQNPSIATVDLSRKKSSRNAVGKETSHVESISEDKKLNTFDADFKFNVVDHKDDQKRPTNSESCITDFDDELDVNSTASASSAALKKAIENAQESIRIAKESIGRKKKGLRSFADKKTKNSSKVEGEDSSQTFQDVGRNRKYGGTVVFPNFVESEKLFVAKKVINEIHEKISESVKDIKFRNNTFVDNDTEATSETDSKRFDSAGKDEYTTSASEAVDTETSKIQVSDCVHELETDNMFVDEHEAGIKVNEPAVNILEHATSASDSVDTETSKIQVTDCVHELETDNKFVNEHEAGIKVNEPTIDILEHQSVVKEVESEEDNSEVSQDLNQYDNGSRFDDALEFVETEKQENAVEHEYSRNAEIEKLEEIEEASKRVKSESESEHENNSKIHKDEETNETFDVFCERDAKDSAQTCDDGHSAVTGDNSQSAETGDNSQSAETGDNSQCADSEVNPHDDCEIKQEDNPTVEVKVESLDESRDQEFDEKLSGDDADCVAMNDINMETTQGVDDVTDLTASDDNEDESENNNVIDNLADLGLDNDVQSESSSSSTTSVKTVGEERNIQLTRKDVPDTVSTNDVKDSKEPQSRKKQDEIEESGPSKVTGKDRFRKIDEEAAAKEREWERNRLAVDRVIREARERAFAEARERAERERAAVEKATEEIRQRMMAEAHEKVSKASVTSKPSPDKTPAQSKLRAERAAVERATSEARQRALEKAISQKTVSDLNRSESALRTKAKLEKHNRIMERAANALAEKEKRDRLAQKEQAERNRLAENLNADIKRWSSGKEGNLRALLSTLQYILGPESGWQPVSLTEIITASAVKKAYRKATLCVHPDKLQQRGATVQQKYICEKVFDLLKAAWNRFNSEER